jgi:sortase A
VRAVRWGIGALGEVLVTAGAVLLLFVVWQLFWTDVQANRAQSTTVTTLEHDFTSQPKESRPPGVQPPAVRMGKAFAILRIPRFGAHYARPVFEGTDHDTLIKGVGHYIGTAKPGELGNFAIAGHRTTYGRPFSDIDLIRKGDRIIVETRTGYSVYVVLRHEIVRPTHTQVLAPVPDQPGATPIASFLTMTACHPKYSAARRYVVFAQLVKTYTRAQGVPPADLLVPAAAAVGRAA